MAGSKNTSAKNGKTLTRKGYTAGPDSRPYNHYNLYFILERELFLQERGVYPSMDRIAEVSSFQWSNIAGSHTYYNGIDLPSLPPRYSSLILPYDWFVHKKKKRAHVKTHGLVSFREMAAMVASRWKQEDKEIVSFMKTVANKIKQRTDELKITPFHVIQEKPTVVQQDPIQIPIEQERFHNMTKFLQDLPMGYELSGACFFVSDDRTSRRLSSISELDMPDDEIIAMWCSVDI
mmetsp:Transcript_31348/g.56794  ORF Transcript_31348/g.56794 Transcript_31348/m.56794 type:complete len:234 (-) Transcript_31348:66-767(-)